MALPFDLYINPPEPTKEELEEAEYCCAHIVISDGNAANGFLTYCEGWADAMKCENCKRILVFLRKRFPDEDSRWDFILQKMGREPSE